MAYLTQCYSVDLCDLTSDQNVSSYQSLVTQKCGCVQCIRKCCKLGYYLGHNRTCFKLQSPQDFRLEVYRNEHYLKQLNQNDFQIGVLQCRYFALNRDDPSDEFRVQVDGNLWLPAVNFSYKSSEYCVDQRDNLTVFACLDTEPLGRELNKYGKVKTSYNNKLNLEM